MPAVLFIPTLILIWAAQLGLMLLWILRPFACAPAVIQIILYIAFVAFIGCAGVMSAVVFKDRGAANHFIRRNTTLLVTEAVLTLMWLSSLWQMTIYSTRPWMAQTAYVGLMAAAVVVKFCWRAFKHWTVRASTAVLRLASTPWGPLAGNILAAVFIFLVIYIPDPKAVVAWLYMGDQFHQWDGNFMGVALGLYNGLLPDVDIISTYGFGMPVLIAGLMKLFGGLSYVNAIQSLFWIGIVYYSLWYFLLRRCFKSGLMAFAAIALGMRAQMFDQAVIPITWTQAPASVVRYCFDILFFWAIYGHVQTHRRIFLVLAALAASIGMYHMMSTGTVLAVTLLCYLGAHLLIPPIRPYVFKSRGDLVFLAVVVLAMPVLMLLWTWLTVKGHALTKEFWFNVTEYNNFFYNNVMTTRVTEALGRKEFLYLAVGLAYPVFYAGSVLYIGTMLYLKKMDYRFIFMALVGVYGFFLHSYYILVSTKYFAVGLPGIFLLLFWLDDAAGRLSKGWRRRMRLASAGVCAYVLLTTHMFMAYPNLLNVSRNPIVDAKVAQRVGHNSYYFNQLTVDFPEAVKLPLNSLGEREEGLKYEKDFKTHQELVDFYRKDSDFSKDADLIRRLTPPGARVPLLSSFEVLLLDQAKRKPFFYYFPLLNSHPMRMRSWMVTLILSRDELAKTIGQLEKEKPQYLFMERIFLTPQVPAWYGYEFEDLIGVIRYALARYEPTEVGRYLVAMKRKDNQ